MIKAEGEVNIYFPTDQHLSLLKEAHSVFKVNPPVKKEAFIWYWTSVLSVPAQIKHISHAKKESKYMTGCEYKHVKYALWAGS